MRQQVHTDEATVRSGFAACYGAGIAAGPAIIIAISTCCKRDPRRCFCRIRPDGGLGPDRAGPVAAQHGRPDRRRYVAGRAGPAMPDDARSPGAPDQRPCEIAAGWAIRTGSPWILPAPVIAQTGAGGRSAHRAAIEPATKITPAATFLPVFVLMGRGWSAASWIGGCPTSTARPTRARRNAIGACPG